MAGQGKGYGSTLGYCSTSGGTFTNVSDVTRVDIPGFDFAELDMGAMDSPNNTVTYKPGMNTVTPINVDLNYIKTHLSGLYAQAGVEQFWKLTTPEGSVATGPGFLSKGSGDDPHDGKMTLKATIRPSGYWTFTPAA